MSNLISGGKWNSEGQTAASIKAAASEPTGLDASLGGCPSIFNSIKRIPATLGFSNCRETTYLLPSAPSCALHVHRIAFDNQYLRAG